jgi:hypothetical protein
MSAAEDSLKIFGISNQQLLEHDLDRVERLLGVDLGRGHVTFISSDQEYYPQIDADIRGSAALMAPHYEVFYSLENSIRRQISDALSAEDGADWWSESRVPARVKNECESRRQKEMDLGLTPRSDSLLDYSTFGELSEIIKSNWAVFGQSFSSARAVERVMALLNSIRGPIAHCSPLADDEIVRLKLAVRDWFRLME